jgi:hypothetical protein
MFVSSRSPVLAGRLDVKPVPAGPDWGDDAVVLIATGVVTRARSAGRRVGAKAEKRLGQMASERCDQLSV